MLPELQIEPSDSRPENTSEEKHVVLLGPPNVGKSVIFNALTGNYVVVSNYPGTTIEISRAKLKIDGESAQLTDTPGTYGLLPIGDDERVTRDLLLTENPDILVHVVDAKSLERMLPLTLQLLELEIPLILVLNMMDEAKAGSLKINIRALSEWLKIPVIPTTAINGTGINELKQEITNILKIIKSRREGEKTDKNQNQDKIQAPAPETNQSEIHAPVEADPIDKPAFAPVANQSETEAASPGADKKEVNENNLEQEDTDLKKQGIAFSLFPDKNKDCATALSPSVHNRNDPVSASAEKISESLKKNTSLEKRASLFASLMLQGDEELIKKLPPEAGEAIALAEKFRNEIAKTGEDPAISVMSRYHRLAREWAAENVSSPASISNSFADRLHRIAIRPVTGVPLLLIILYIGLYWFVGVFGAGTVVDFIEDNIFNAFINPWVDLHLESLFPGTGSLNYWIKELIGGDYGLVPLGLTYAMAIVLPIVALFFLFFSILEDSGYFPRLALLVDRLFKRIGLNGRAVIPIVLGFACDTMATLVTRVQESRRERIITTFLLALAVPCSAQYGVIVAVLAGRGAGLAGISIAFIAWALIVFIVFLIAGRVASGLVPGESPGFYMELPPMRMPRISDVLIKTFARIKWYFLEILPVFLFAGFLIWLGRLTGLFELLTGALVPVVGLLGLPEPLSEIFLYGFFRRDFGAAGLFDLAGEGILDSGQLLVSAVTLTLFMPCVAQVLVMYRERGIRVTLIVICMVILTAFTVGLLVRGGISLIGGLA